MANDCAKRCSVKIIFAGKRNFSLNKEVRLELREKVSIVSVMSLRLSDHKVLHNFARIFSVFSLIFRISKLLEFKEFNKTIIPFTLVGFETV